MLYQFSEKPAMIRFQVNVHPHDRFLESTLSTSDLKRQRDP